MAEESEDVLQNEVIWLQKMLESLCEGFDVEYNDLEYSFIPLIKER